MKQELCTAPKIYYSRRIFLLFHTNSYGHKVETCKLMHDKISMHEAVQKSYRRLKFAFRNSFGIICSTLLTE